MAQQKLKIRFRELRITLTELDEMQKDAPRRLAKEIRDQFSEKELDSMIKRERARVPSDRSLWQRWGDSSFFSYASLELYVLNWAQFLHQLKICEGCGQEFLSNRYDRARAPRTMCRACEPGKSKGRK